MSSYRYFRMGKFLVCLDQSLPGAVNHLVFRYGQNGIGAIGMSRKLARAAARAVVRGRLRRLPHDRVAERPAFGVIGLEVHGGAKLFDFGRGEVVKVFAPGTPADDAAREIDASRQASKVPAAPRFIEADGGGHWYREEYVCGVHATSSRYRAGRTLAGFYGEVEACLLDVVASGDVQHVDADAHFSRLADGGFRARWIDAGQEPGQVDAIARYLDELCEWLSSHSQPGPMQLVPVHGDFSLVNAIATDGGLRFIDWEGIGPGGVFDDIFNFLFVEQYYGRADDAFAEDVEDFTRRYAAAIRERLPGLRQATEVEPAYARRQYYLERLRLLLDRDVTENLGNVVLKSIRMFREFDRSMGDADPGAGR